MNPTIKNIIIFVAIGVALFLAYIYFFPKTAPEANLTTANPASTTSTALPSGQAPTGDDFLSILLNVKSIKLNDAIFSDPAFLSLHDSSILLISDGTEGRPNPFAPIGSDASLPSSSNTNITSTNTLNSLNTNTPAGLTTTPSTTAPSTPVISTTPSAPATPSNTPPVITGPNTKP